MHDIAWDEVDVVVEQVQTRVPYALSSHHVQFGIIDLCCSDYVLRRSTYSTHPLHALRHGRFVQVEKEIFDNFAKIARIECDNIFDNARRR